ncbi:MAG: 2-oxoacid:acceptor oxidoreductase subunit alpha [Candidatus Brocadiaceae bacterium]|nr:2-oxoacid:acceptor oxidoreductase subunit alpha [Candidatus Brocadiaceae bacterium]
MSPKIKNPLPPGNYFFEGNQACAEAAIAAGCRFFAGYPISPSSEIMERLSWRLPEVGGVFIQMEDEIASISAVIGAVWAGARAMTATSGPGLSLMLENIGYAIITETPCVIVDVQRAGPSTGQATRPYDGDIMQVKWGSSGDYQVIALAPWSVQEVYDLTIRAFNLAELYRVPVFVMSDAALAHLREDCRIPEGVDIVGRTKAKGVPHFGTEGPVGVPPMASFGEEEGLIITGSTHDKSGYRKTQDPNIQKDLVDRLNEKVLSNAKEIIQTEEHFLKGAEIVVVAYGLVARAALAAVKEARLGGINVGLLRLKTLWPFPKEEIRALRARRIIVPELNRGQLVREVERVTKVEVVYVNRVDGEVMGPGEILEAIKKQ